MMVWAARSLFTAQEAEGQLSASVFPSLPRTETLPYDTSCGHCG